RVHDARGAEPGHPTDHRRAGEALLAELLEQHLIERLAVILVALADEDAHQGALAFEAVRHGAPPLRATSSPVRAPRRSRGDSPAPSLRRTAPRASIGRPGAAPRFRSW